MNRAFPLSLAGAAVLLTGCNASLKVDVAVLNPSYLDAVRTEYTYIKEVNDLALGRNTRASRVSQASAQIVRDMQMACYNLIAENDAQLLTYAKEELEAATAALTKAKSELSKIKGKDAKAVAARAKAQIKVVSTEAAVEALEKDQGRLEGNKKVIKEARKNDALQRRLEREWFAQLVEIDTKTVSAVGDELKAVAGLPGYIALRSEEEKMREEATAPVVLSTEAKAALTKRNLAYGAISQKVKVEADKVSEQCFGFTGTRIASPKLQLKEQAKLIKSKTELTEKADEAEEQAEAVAQTTITGGGSLLNTFDEAFFVVKAPDSAWAKDYNKAFGSGLGGNTSIAIKMNDTADFSIKGFVFDGRSTADMVSKLATQAVATVAAAYGAPIAMTREEQGSDTFLAKFADGKNISSFETQIAVAEAEAKAFRRSVFRISNTILTNFGDLTGDETAETAQAMVEATIDANKSSWKKPEGE
jgi:hypothetical protein